MTGEVSRSRVAPAHRESVRKFLARFDGPELEVALEATTGWRFVVEELHRVGAGVHLAEPAETAARRGRKKRAKTDRADARLLRGLVMVGRLPESWIAPEHILDPPSSATHGGSPPRARRSATRALTSPSTSPISAALPATSPARDRQRCAGRYTRPPSQLTARAAQAASTTCRQPSDSAATARAWRSRASF